jgi:hypothetical protein
MGIFSSIKNAIFGHREEAPEPAHATATAAAAPRPAARQPQPAVLDEVDVEARLNALPGASELNWRSSIVDLMKLIGIDSSYDNRKQLATEFGNTSYEGSAEDNIKLHRQTMQELAKNGGKVPKELLG